MIMPALTKYPTGVKYREALFDTNRCFKDPALVGGMVTMDNFGMPKPISGAAGSVFTVQNANGRRWAVKCFTRFVADQEVRYQRISETLQSVSKPWRVEFEYLHEGVLCEGIWYPVLKMEWVDAASLIPFIENHLWEPTVIADLAEKFMQVVRDLSALNIAHGDLQHGNLLITPSGELKLIDYDGMFVPSLANMGASEKGHMNYQSPTRTMRTWGPYLDNFSAWVIYTSLVAITIDPTLWSLLHNPGDEALLFHHTDYEDPRSSRALLALAQSSELPLHAVGTVICNVWTPDVRAVPPLNPDDLPQPSGQPVSPGQAPSRAVPTTSTVPSAIPDWVTDAQALPLAAAPNPASGASWVTGHLPPLPPVAFSPSRLEARILALLSLVVIAALVLSAKFGQLPAVAASSLSWFVVLIFIAFTTGLFRRTPEQRAKHDKLAILKERRAEASRTAREVKRLEADRRDVDNHEKKAVDKLSNQADKSRADEQKELAGANARLVSAINKLQKQRQSLQSSEDKENANALRLLQTQHVAAYLGRSSISSARIPGIGPGIVGSLAANGVRTAADFTGIAYSTGSRGGQRVLIKHRNGGYVHPNGVGEKKANALESWRRSAEMQARASQPSALPSAQAQAIRAKYMQQRQNLATEEQAARARVTNEQKQIIQKWAQTHISISGQLISTRGAFAKERAEAEIRLTEARKHASAATWQKDLATREVSAYRSVSYRRYLTRIIRTL
jgi:hypothetical protein